MVRYHTALMKAWNELIQMYESKKFEPKNEYQIQAFLYYQCAKQLGLGHVHFEHKVARKRIDLTLGGRNENHLLVEIKDWNSIGHRNSKKKTVLRDLNKLEQTSKAAHARLPIFILFLCRIWEWDEKRKMVKLIKFVRKECKKRKIRLLVYPPDYGKISVGSSDNA